MIAVVRDAMVQVEEIAALTYGAETPPEGFGRSIIGDRIRELVSELSPDLGASFAADLLGYAFDQVDWVEIADAWKEDVAEQAAYCC